MPQLDFAQFPPQLVWLVLSFVVLYLGLSRYILPRLSDLLLERRTRIANDVDEAELLERDKEHSLARAEETLAKARRAGEAHVQEAATAASGEAEAAFAKAAARARDDADAAADALKAQRLKGEAALAAASHELAASLLSGVLDEEADEAAHGERLKTLTQELLAASASEEA